VTFILIICAGLRFLFLFEIFSVVIGLNKPTHIKMDDSIKCKNIEEDD
jgi:hypothetical protein